jgi:STE24 endopeptidase
MNGYLIFVLALLVFDFALEFIVERLNIARLSPEIPEEFRGVYDAEKYAKSQNYTREGTRFEMLKSAIMLPLTIGFILLGGFHWTDAIARSAGWGLIPTGLIFAAILGALSMVVGLPFGIYDTFVIETRYGFNKTSPATFIADLAKEILLGAILGGAVLAGVLWFFTHAGNFAWLYAWGALAVFQLALMFIAPVVILPLFNKFTPLEDGELRQAIEKYAASQNVPLAGIFKIDGSKRSTKSNAYFTGFGRTKRIALFDTLIEKHTTPELVAVLAHEVGHSKLGHIKKSIVVSLTSSLLMFWILSRFIGEPRLYEAFKVPFTAVGGHPPIYAGLLFFGFLYAPISLVLGLLGNMLSRKHEFEADAFAAKTAGAAETMIAALKKLSVDNLSNLTPHPLKVFLEYSHPPVLARIAALRANGRQA